MFLNKFFSLFILISILLAQNQSSVDILQQIRSNAERINNNYNPNIEAKYLQAKTLERSGLFDEAAILYKEISRINPGNSKYYISLKNYLKQNENWDTLFTYTKAYAEARDNDFLSQFEYLDLYILINDEQNWKKLSNQLILESNLESQNIKTILKLLINSGNFDFCYEVLIKYREQIKKPDFYCIELASYLGMRMSYEKSLKEYLIFLKYNPKQLQTVSNRIMAFPDDDEINIKVKSILKESSFKSAKYILADLQFRSKNFDTGFKTLINNNATPLMFLNFAKDLSSIQEYIRANKVLTHLINSTKDEKILTEAIFEIAKSFEAQLIRPNNNLSLTGFHPNNPFFSSPYLSIANETNSSLQEAMGIYDSLRVTKQNAQAAYRLAEVQFRVLGDLDAALYLYEETFNKGNSTSLKKDAGLGIIDIYIAKNDLLSAEAFCSKIILEEPNILEYQIKSAQILFYKAEFDKTDSELRKIVSKLPMDHSAVNDILDVMAILIGFRHNQDDFFNFVKAQLNIQQNKRTEALEKLEALFNSQEIFIEDMCRYQYSWLSFLQGDTESARTQLNSIVNETIFKELAHIFQAEIIDYIDQDLSRAIDTYLKFLELYPNSIYYDDVRLRLRTLAS